MEPAIDPRYPIGKFELLPYSEELRKKWLADIQFLPQDIERAIQTLDEHQLQTPYREGGWTVNQLVHHIADSHMNAYIRFKQGLTETNPHIRPYDQNGWATTRDVQTVPVNVSVTLLHALHRRLLAILEGISEDDFNTKTVFHPEHNKELTLWFLLGMYAWHSRHHLAHINNLKEKNGW